MAYCKQNDTLIAKGKSLSLDMCLKTSQKKERMTEVSYTNAIGSLTYVMMCIRTDISYAIGLVSKYQSNPG